MATKQFTAEELKLFFSGKYYHSAYDETVELANRIRVHAEGEYPEDMISVRRPNESEAIQEYREQIWKAVTKPYFGKVLTSLNKIRRSTEWSVRFKEDAAPASIPEKERLEAYLNKNFPHFTSLTNWVFALLLKQWAVDPNSWVVVMPADEEIIPNEYVRPYPYIFHSHQIIEPREYGLVVLSDDKIVYREGDTTHFGDRYYVVYQGRIETWEQRSTTRRFELAREYETASPVFPAFKLKSLVKSSYDGIFINESRLSGMMEQFDEAAREYSDLQADVVQHIYNEKWEIGTNECSTCKGTGVVTLPGFSRHPTTCTSCNGTRYQPRGPYTTLVVPQPMAGEQSQPMPPMGYVQKDVEIIKVQDERIKDHIWQGLAAINMEFLYERPLNQSGVAKAYDADETNNFVHSCAEDLIAMMDNVALIVNELRYGLVVSDPEKRAEMLPEINVPERFDLFSAKVIEENLTNAKNSKVNPVILNEMEIQYANKVFSTSPEVRDKLAAILKLDPLPNITEEDKMTRLANNGITKETYIISSNIHAFVTRALEEKGESFYTMDTKEQREMMLKYAGEQVTNTSPARNIISEVTQP